MLSQNIEGAFLYSKTPSLHSPQAGKRTNSAHKQGKDDYIIHQ